VAVTHYLLLQGQRTPPQTPSFARADVTPSCLCTATNVYVLHSESTANSCALNTEHVHYTHKEVKYPLFERVNNFVDGTNDHLDDNLLHDSYQFPTHSRRLPAEVDEFVCMLFIF
jgi:hypothetical protein